MASFHHQHGIARRQGVDQRGFPGAGPRSRIDEYVAAGLEHILQAFEHTAAERAEFGSAMVDDRPRHRPQNAVGNRGGTRYLQEVAPGDTGGIGRHLVLQPLRKHAVRRRLLQN